MRSDTIPIPIYGGTLTIIQAAELTEVMKAYGFKGDASNCGAFTEWQGSDLFVAFDTNPYGALVAHECVHLKNQLFINIQAQVDRSNDEPEAYLVGWFFEQIERFLNL